MRHVSLWRRRCLAALTLALAGAGSAIAQTAPAPTGEPIRIGMIEMLSGPFANTGEAVLRNLIWATERVNARGGVKLPAALGGARPLVIERFDSKGQTEEALAMLRGAIDKDIRIVTQGNSSAVAAVKNVVRIPEMQQVDSATFNAMYRQRRMIFKPEDLSL